MNEYTKIGEAEAVQLFDKYLDSVHYRDVVILGYRYRTSEALKSVDPIAYRCELLDWLDSEQLEID